ncbi:MULTISPECIES: cupin domain-containing protein [unclassified Cupriavidus]|uniref:cupin domain-containing protein n=1 Tax=Cupriavidus sp. H19C3 TaxID=3241603 RepID=UPI003BF7A8A0
MSEIDWLSHLLQIITVTGQIEVRCVYAAPWRTEWPQAAARQIPYHVVLKGRAMIEEPGTGMSRELAAGDIVLFPHGSPHVLHDGSGQAPARTSHRRGAAGWLLSENAGPGEQMDLLCGRFFIQAPHDRLIRDYFPSTLVVGALGSCADAGATPATNPLADLVALMRVETAADQPGACEMLNALSTALFTLVLRAATKSARAETGLLALAGHPRLAPAVAAMFARPAHPWNLHDLAALCGITRATLIRDFQARLDRPALDLLTDIRMSVAANALTRPDLTTGAVARSVGYLSVPAFRRAFAHTMGITPAQWRRLARERQ